MSWRHETGVDRDSEEEEEEEALFSEGRAVLSHSSCRSFHLSRHFSLWTILATRMMWAQTIVLVAISLALLPLSKTLFASYGNQLDIRNHHWPLPEDASHLLSPQASLPEYGRHGAGAKFSNSSHKNKERIFTAKGVDSLQSKWSANTSGSGKLLRLHLTAIHLDGAEFPLSRLLFSLTLRLALDSLSEQLEREQRVKLVLSVRGANTCSHQFAAAVAAEEYFTKQARMFIVSGCDEAIRGVSRLASLWRVPVMTAAGFGQDLNNKSVHKTLIRVAFSLRAAVEFMFKVLKSFQWRRVNLIVDESDPNSLALMGAIEEHLSENRLSSGPASGANSTEQQYYVGLNTVRLDFKSFVHTTNESVSTGSYRNSTTRAPADEVKGAPRAELEVDRWPGELANRLVADTLRQCSMFSRVSVLLLPQQHLRRFMLSAYDQNMANGLYTFINLPLISAASSEQEQTMSSEGAVQSSPMSKQAPPAYPMPTGDQVFLWRSARSARNGHARKAFESLMSIYLRIPSTKARLQFASRLSQLANTEYASATTTTAAASSFRQQPLNINPYSASFYDSLQIYVIALNESLSQLKRVHLQRQRRRQQVTISPSNSSDGGEEAALSSLHASIAEVVRNRRFNNMITGQIYINPNGDRETDYTLDDMNPVTGKFAPVILYRGDTRSIERTGRIHWSSDASIGPTSDSTDCSLTNSCQGKPMTKFALILTLVAGPLLLAIGSLIYFVYTRLSLESQLVDQWWKIRQSEIEIVLTRRKNANDGSLVVVSTVVGGGGASASVTAIGAHSAGHESFSSPEPAPSFGRQVVAASEASGLSGGGGAAAASNGATMLIGAGGRFKTSTVANSHSMAAYGRPSNRTEITKATNTTGTNVSAWGQTSSAKEVCYGDITLGIYKLAKVALKPISKFQQSRKLLVELRSLKDVNHANLCRFIGIIVDEGNWAIVSEFCSKGSLREFFHNESMVIDWTFKYSIINDILAGLAYLHSSPLGYHGRLKSSNCLVNARFVVKLSDYGPHSLFEQVNDLAKSLSAKSDSGQSNGEAEDGKDKIDDEESSLLKKRIWLAPEHMLTSSKTIGSMKGDVYSLGLLLYEIITNSLPFFDQEKNDFVMPLKTLCAELKSHGPNEKTGPRAEDIIVSDENNNIEPLVEVMKLCWQYESSKRPSLQMVDAAIRRITRGVTSKKLLENLTTRMEQYTNNLESLVEAKLATLVEEKLKTEELLYQFVPKSIAALLKEGQFVEPEAFECVTVFYSDIVGFTSLSAESSPMEVVDFLSDLYLCFDETLEQHDIFKVDTIGDAYIVASGLPQRNEGKHVVEIASAALELRDRLRSFKIPHKPGRSLEMRVGIHSGPCVAGIVGGLNMPKYCVFGDTLAIGNFMESTGQPMKIHISEESKKLLSGVEGFTFEQRSPRITRDGLPFQTYWLEKDDSGHGPTQ